MRLAFLLPLSLLLAFLAPQKRSNDTTSTTFSGTASVLTANSIMARVRAVHFVFMYLVLSTTKVGLSGTDSQSIPCALVCVAGDLEMFLVHACLLFLPVRTGPHTVCTRQCTPPPHMQMVVLGQKAAFANLDGSSAGDSSSNEEGALRSSGTQRQSASSPSSSPSPQEDQASSALDTHDVCQIASSDVCIICAGTAHWRVWQYANGLIFVHAERGYVPQQRVQKSIRWDDHVGGC